MWFSQKWWPWPWLLSDFKKKKIVVVLEPEYIICQKIRTIGPVVWPVHREHDGQTDKQTDRQTDRQTDTPQWPNILCKNLRFCKVTNRGDQYTLQKSTILQSNKVKRRRIVIKFGTVLPVRVSTGSKKFQIFWIFFDDFRANNTL